MGIRGISVARAISLLAVLSAISPISLAQNLGPGAAQSLYSRLGGTPQVSVLVGESVDKIFTMPARAAARDLLVKRICSRAGGGCSDAVTPDFSANEYRSLIEGLRDSMRTHDVPLAARNELLEILDGMRQSAVRR